MQCLECEHGYGLNSNTCEQLLCELGTQGSCTRCYPGFYNNAGTCEDIQLDQTLLASVGSGCLKTVEVEGNTQCEICAQTATDYSVPYPHKS